MDAVSEKVYREQILPWLPEEIIDCHVHVGLPEHFGPIGPERIAAMLAIEVADSFAWHDLKASFEMLFCDRKVSSLTFGLPYREVDIEAANSYVLGGAISPDYNSTALAMTLPQWNEDKIESLLDSGFAGLKPYPDLALGGSNECSIYDFLPKSHLEVLNRRGGVLMLHLPRKGRLADPNNIRELLEIRQAYSSIKLIVAHIGRSYCLPTAKAGLPHFANDPGVYFDTAANLNADVFEYALDTIGPDRILYGSDLPITLMRGVREHVGDKYINYTDGPYSWNTNRKSHDIEANYTYYLYEEIIAITKAIERCGLGKEAAEKIFYSNCAQILYGGKK